MQTQIAGRARHSPDRLGPLEITIALMVLSVALVLVLVGRGFASSSAGPFDPSIRAAVSVPAMTHDAERPARTGVASFRALPVPSVERNVAPPSWMSADDAAHPMSVMTGGTGDSSDD